MEIKIINPIKAFKPFDLSPVSITPSKHNTRIRKPNIFKFFWDFKKLKMYPIVMKQKPHKNKRIPNRNEY